MIILKLVFKNALRHKLRSSLTIFGISIVIIAFCILRTVITAWYVGLDASAANRLVTRHSVSFIFPLPYSYKDKIEKVNGVEMVTYANWFGGTYVDKTQFFARIAVDAATFFDVYPEFKLSKDEYSNFLRERNSCVVGSKIAKQYNFKVGDIIPLNGDIFPGKWEFVVRGIYQPREKTTDATQLIFHWDYLNERMLKETPVRANEIGWLIIKIKNPSQSAQISETIDQMMKNSPAETKTETERAFTQGFISAFSGVISAMNGMSFVIVGIIMLVLGNTMIMSARERTKEYAVLKTIGFSSKHLIGLIMGEALLISCLGGAIGMGLSVPLIIAFEEFLPKGVFPVFQLEPITVILAVSTVVFIGIASSVFPIQRTLKTKIVEGFRFVG